jgi:hypothetical protein
MSYATRAMGQLIPPLLPLEISIEVFMATQ